MQMIIKDHKIIYFPSQAPVGQKEDSMILQAAVFQNFFFTISWSVDDPQLFIHIASNI